MYDFLVVGGGFSGCVLAERLATELGKRVLVVERRGHIAGNAYDYYNEDGILVHKYGPHVFHTNSRKVWEYLGRFTKWRRYDHRVVATIDGKRVPVPFNLNSLHQVFSADRAEHLERLLIEGFGQNSKVPILDLRESAQGELRELSEYIYRKLFYEYTLKQWGMKPEELDPSVTARVPVLIGRDDRYFQDRYQGIPKDGYTEMFKRLTDDSRIDVVLNADYRSVINDIRFDKLVYTGPIDNFFDYVHGELPYRSLRFEMKSFRTDWFQEVAQVNYPDSAGYTRTTEFKHMTGQVSDSTSVSFEYPEAFIAGRNEPFYPVPREENRQLYERYRNDARKHARSVMFIGRLAEYRYYNMDQIVARALKAFEKEIACVNV